MENKIIRTLCTNISNGRLIGRNIALLKQVSSTQIYVRLSPQKARKALMKLK